MSSDSQEKSKKKPPKSYEQKVSNLIKRSYNLVNRPLPDDVATHTRDWLNFLYGRVPETELVQTFEDAAYSNETRFAVTAHDVLTAWNVRAEERRRKQQDRFCSQYQHHTGDKSQRETLIAHPNGIQDLTAPCPTCRPEEFHAIYQNVVAQTKDPFTEGCFALVRAALAGAEATMIRDIRFTWAGEIKEEIG